MKRVKRDPTFDDRPKAVELDLNANVPWTLCLSSSGAHPARGARR